MLHIIIKHEILNNFMNVRFVILVVLCVVLIPLGIYVNMKDYTNRLTDYHKLVEEYQEELKKSMDVREIRPKGFRRPSSLSILVKGLENSLPKYFICSKSEGLQFLGGSTTEESDIISSLFEKFDFLFIVKVILSMFVFLFTFDAISGEKERGTLRLILSNPVPRSILLLGKLIGGVFTFLVPFVIGCIMGLVLLITSQLNIKGPLLIRMMLMAGVSFLYITVCFNLGIFVSSRTKTPLNSILVLSLIWIAMVHVIPTLGGLVAQAVYPVKSPERLYIEKLLITKSIQQKKSELLKEMRPHIGKPGYMAEYKSYIKLRKPIVQKLEKERKFLIANLEENYRKKKRHQEVISLSISRLSPASCFSYLMSELADTGVRKRERFYTAAKNYYEVVEREVFDKFWTDVFADGYKIMGWEPVDKDKIPHFKLPEQTLTELYEAIWLDLLLLVIFNLLYFLSALSSLLNYDVR